MRRFLACDWGTTNLRAWVVGEDGAVERQRDFPLGVSKLKAGEAQQRFEDEVRPALQAQAMPALLCGMIGSTLGWTVAPYLDCPVDRQGLAAGLMRVETSGAPVCLVPGLKGPGFGAASEVMRGEETQVFGWLAQDPSRSKGRHLVCHPGTHAKWILVEDGRVVRFLTAMTGELFDVLRKHSVLRSDAPADDEAAFQAGLTAAGAGDALATRLFSARTRVVADGAAADSAPSYLSGLLIGAEIAGTPRLFDMDAGATVHLIGDPGLCGWYQLALDHAGIRSRTHDGDAAALAGLTALQEALIP